MLESVENLVKSFKDKKVGNHATFFTRTGASGDLIQYFTYHNNVICRANHTRKEAYLTNAGWATVSTNRALNDYKGYFISLDYKVEDTREK